MGPDRSSNWDESPKNRFLALRSRLSMTLQNSDREGAVAGPVTIDGAVRRSLFHILLTFVYAAPAARPTKEASLLYKAD
jgi:hypothetical protein